MASGPQSVARGVVDVEGVLCDAAMPPLLKGQGVQTRSDVAVPAAA